MTASYIRVRYKNIGIYEAYKSLCTNSDWAIFKHSQSWLPNPGIYANCIYYFTTMGFNLFMKYTYPILLQKLQNNDINYDIRIINSHDIQYQDEYQIVVKEL